MSRFRAVRVKQLVVFLLTILLISSSAYLLGWSSVLTVKAVSVAGTSSQAEIFQKLAADSLEFEVGSKLARIETRAIKRSIGNLAWIDEANVSRDWFGRRVQITVIEKVAVAKAISNESGLVNFDSSGEMFEPISASQRAIQEKLPLVITQGGDKSQLASVATFLAQLPTDISDLVANLEAITVANSGFIEMQTKIGGQELRINWGIAKDVNQKFEILNALLKLPENKQISRVDLSQPDLPIVS
jgi:cell division septal protein FtsQ